MSEIMLASAGEVVKLWEGANYTLSQQILSPSNVAQVSWSPNGQFLAISSLNQPIVPIYFCKKALTQPLELLPEIPQSYVRFGNTSSRFVITCGNSPEVTIWDLKTRKASKKLNTGLSNGVTCAAYNSGDTHVASGGHDGSVVLTNVISSVSLAPMVPSFAEPQAITSMQFSPMQKNLLGTVSDDGCCVLWDCNARLLLHSFSNVHVAPATGIAFSPTNEVLLATVGLDKRLFYYDLQFKKTVIAVKLESPSTCVDFSPDGTYVAVGGYKGSISIYDVRAAHLPVNAFSAHRKAVSAVSFNKSPGAVKDTFFRAGVTRRLESGISTPEIDKFRDGNSNNISDVLSPVRDCKQSEIISYAQDTHLFKETSQLDASSHLASEDNPKMTAQSADVNFSRDSSDRELATLNSERCSSNNIAANVPSSHTCAENGIGAPSDATNVLAEHSATSVDDCTMSTSMTNGLPEQWREEMKHQMYQLRDSLHQDIVNLQMEMLRNFFKQKNEFEEMLGYRNLAANLTAEVNVLKKEIADLKKHY